MKTAGRFTAVVLALLCVASVRGDELDAARQAADAYRASVVRLLASGDARLEAWGAFYAAELPGAAEDEGLRDALLDVLRRRGRGASVADRDAAQAVLDALIRARMHVPVATVYPQLVAHPAETVILLARQRRESRAVLREALDRPLPRAVWMAVVNVLVEERVPGVAAYLLRDLEVRLRISVLPARNMVIGVGGGDGERTVVPPAIPRHETPPGWPPVARWQLTDEPREDAVVVIRGAHPVYARRVDRERAADALDTALSPSVFRFLALAALAEVPRDTLGFEAEERLTVYWEGEEDYVEKVQEAWRRIRRFHGFLVTRLVHEELLTGPEAAALRPRVVVEGRWMGLGDRELPEVPEPE